jgi:S-adenosylmethionine decarboxylase
MSDLIEQAAAAIVDGRLREELYPSVVVGRNSSAVSTGSSNVSLGPSAEEDSDSDISQPQQAPHESGGEKYESFADVDEDYNAEDRPYNGVFEGPEKTLEVCFRRGLGYSPEDMVEEDTGKVGLRRLAREDLDAVCRRARCTILSTISNAYLDAYVLSESSLFVYPYMVVIKTCGTTTLLRCVATLINLGKKLGLEIDWVGYSRKNFNFPEDQMFPHGSFHEELEYMQRHRALSERLEGNGYTLGPITSDHWFVFVADKTVRSHNIELDTDRVLNIMMFDIDPEVANLFYYDRYQKKKQIANPDEAAGVDDEESKEKETRRVSKDMTRAAGIDALVPGAVVDPCAFEPCGYSMNAILFRSYSTMHITPEEGSSYASFETNAKLTSYTSLINNVVRTFKPRKFVMTLMADEGGLSALKDHPFALGKSGGASIVVPSSAGTKILYKRSNLASIQVEEDTCCMMGNWVADDLSYNQSLRADKARGMTVG